MSAPTPSYAAPPMASAPTQTPAAPYAGSQPGAYHGPQPGTYGGPPAGRTAAAPTVAGPPRRSRRGRSRPPPPPRPRRRRPSAFVGLVSLGIALVGLGLGAALDDPIGFPGSSATLGFLIALTGVSLVVLALGHLGPRPPASAACSSSILGLLLVAVVGRVAGRGPGRRRRPHLDPGARLRHLEPSSSAPVTRPSTCAGSTPTSPGPRRRLINVEMGVGGLTILVPDGPRRPGRRQRRHRQHPPHGRHRRRCHRVLRHRPSPPRPPIGEEPVDVVVDAELGLGEITIQEQ